MADEKKYLDYDGLTQVINKIKSLFATKEYVDNAIENIPTGGGSGTSVIAYGLCETAGNVAEKVVTITNMDNWELVEGTMVTIKFTNTNTVSKAKLNVNGSGAYPIYASASEYTSAGNFAGYSNRHITYQFNGTHWVFISWSADTQSNTNSTDTSNKIFIVGATKQGSNQTTYSHDTVYIGTDSHVYSNDKQVVNLSDSQALTNKTYEGYTLGDACAKGVDTTVTQGSDNLVTSGAVKNALNSISTGGTLAPTGVTAGTYGTYSSGNYYIPNFTVDEYGRLTNATQNYLGYASSKSDGMMQMAMYNYVTGNTHLLTTYGVFALDESWHSITLSYPDYGYYSYNDNGSIAYKYTPKVYGVYAEINVNGGVYWMQAPHYISCSYDSKYSTMSITVYVKFPKDYIDSNTSRTTVHYIVLHERTYPTTTSSGM